jgi:hypothetical protein
MRLATYQIAEGAECAVYYFGPGQGGSVQANIDRWIGQFQGPKTALKVEKRTISGLKITTVDVSGAYNGMGGPNAPEGPPKQDYRLLGAIVEGPQGSVFFKFTGPAKTVAENQAAFEKMLSSLGVAQALLPAASRLVSTSSYNNSAILKKNGISTAAVSGASEPCTAFRSIFLANFLRMVPSAA